MNRVVLSLLFVLMLTACKGRKNETAGPDPFPVLSFLQSQVRHVDTSLYAIIKIKKANGVADTTYLQREAFKSAAQDFLSLPDIASRKWKNAYTETRLYDEDLKKVVITYLPKEKADLSEITRQDVLIEPGNGSADQVQTIYIETVLNSSDSTVQKRLTWTVNQAFQVIKLVAKKDSPKR